MPPAKKKKKAKPETPAGETASPAEASSAKAEAPSQPLDPKVLKILTESEDAEAELIPIVTQNQDFFEVFRNEDGMSKVRCKATGHEMPARLAAVQEFMKGPKFRKREMYATDFSKYEPDIVPHKDMKKHLYCRLTGTILPRDPKKVEAHINSARYKELHKKQQEEQERRKAKEQEVAARKRKARELREASAKEKPNVPAKKKSKKAGSSAPVKDAAEAANGDKTSTPSKAAEQQVVKEAVAASTDAAEQTKRKKGKPPQRGKANAKKKGAA
mmetsp:Transcript_12210/g.28459  ORF Transcript_12210/g.28459 Transcript_12210/m.28459 type:complete len:272 (+) Transcript_12210:47-862(+)